MWKRKGLFLVVLAMLLVVSACSSKAVDKTEESQKAVVGNFIKIVYFDKGTYKDFSALYADPAKANTEQEFNHYRQKTKPKDVFPIDYESVDKATSHLVVKKVDQNNANVYWVKDPSKDKVDKAPLVWSVKNVKGKWLLK